MLNNRQKGASRCEACLTEIEVDTFRGGIKEVEHCWKNFTWYSRDYIEI